MKTADFLREHSACCKGAKWALSVSSDMADVWDELLNQGKHDWLIWTATRRGVFPDSVLRKLACRFVRETPIGGGETVWDLLEDARSRKAVEVAEAYADGKATEAELDDAYAAAWAAEAAAWAADAADAADAAAWAANATASADAAAAADAAIAAYLAAYLAARAAAAADVAAVGAADADQARMIAELGNPFKKEA